MKNVNRRMKVMHIISGDLWAGAEVQAYTLLSGLHKECDLHVVLMNPGELQQKLLELGVVVTLLDESALGGVAIFLALRKTICAFSPDIVHTHRQKENILGSLANFLSERAKSVRTSHGAAEFTLRGLRRAQSWLDDFAGRYLQQAIIAVSSDLAEQLAQKFPREKIHIINNGIDVAAIKQLAGDTEFRNAAPDAVHIGIIGRLEPVKRVDIFLEMAALLKSESERSQFRFHVIGDGKLRKELEDQSTQLNLDGVLTFHGHRKDMSSCISSLDLVVMCSDHEGTPMTALEALALGKILIAHDVGGLREILSDYPGLLVQEHSPSGYAKCVQKNLQAEETINTKLQDRYLAKNNCYATKELYLSLLCQ